MIRNSNFQLIFDAWSKFKLWPVLDFSAKFIGKPLSKPVIAAGRDCDGNRLGECRQLGCKTQKCGSPKKSRLHRPSITQAIQWRKTGYETRRVVKVLSARRLTSGTGRG